nr:MAG TPA: hypothetical protein [Caudoviricetes sp.]
MGVSNLKYSLNTASRPRGWIISFHHLCVAPD